ncbi:MAG: peptidoglycan bridge formation glycyltransferase FemA/FemB family protein [Candidatus Falkowbacteria bacterium]|nr:peptidoglycan bridge formation glycyltransferase FemA/FemB family protein [Candidatus Falkowbacteria bacterium]
MINSSNSHFLQSSFWSRILVAESERLLNFSEPSMLAIASLKNLKFGYHYGYFPRGPIFLGIEEKREKGFADLFERLFVFAKTEKVIFLRIEPNFKDYSVIDKQSKRFGLRILKSIDLQPRRTWVLNLKKDLALIEKELSQKTRYNIRLAEKKGVKIVQSGEQCFSDFWSLMKTTGERDSFGIHSKKHYLNLIKSGADNIELWFAEINGRKIAAGLFCFYDGVATYLHGASDNEFRNLMAPHLLQWRIIEEAKRRGFVVYDFYGIDEKKWPGVTRFKKGFGGEELYYPGTYDLVLKPACYFFYQNSRMIYRKLRKFL